MTAIVGSAPPTIQQFFDNQGNPAVGGSVLTQVGGVNYATYQDAAGATPLPNPIPLNSRGEVSNASGVSCQLFLVKGVTYIFTLYNAAGNQLNQAASVAADSTSTLLAAPSGSSLVGFIQSGTGSVARTLQSKSRDIVNIADKMTQAEIDDVMGNTLSMDVTQSILDAISSVGDGGKVVFLPGGCKVTAPIIAENKRGITLEGASGQYQYSGSRIVASHTGKAVLSLVGSLFCRVQGIGLEGATASRPKTGLLLGRSSAASAGYHVFDQMNIQGFYSVAGLYNVASEVNNFHNCYILPSSAADAGAYISGTDGLSIGGLTGSSCEANTFVGGGIGNADNTSGSTGLYLDCGKATGHHQFFGTFMAKNGGDSYILIRLGVVDGQSTIFPISFYNVVGEKITTGPAYGLHILNGTAGALSLAGLTVKNGRFEDITSNHIAVTGGTTTALNGADISTPWTSSPVRPSTFSALEGSHLSMLYESEVDASSVVTGCDVVYGGVWYAPYAGGGNFIRAFDGTALSLSPFTTGLVQKQIAPVYGATVNIDASLGNQFVIAVTNGTAFTIANPANAKQGQEISISIRNGSGGATGTVTWDTLYKYGSWVAPANGYNRTVTFFFNGANWTEKARTPADVPN